MASDEDYQFVTSIGTGAENAMITTLVIPFAFMVLMSVSMNRVWALYNMLQLLINLSNYEMVYVPVNMEFLLRTISNIVNFSILEQQNV